MRKKNIILLALILIIFFAYIICFADNPIIQTIYTADPAPMVYNDTVYLYTTHDEDGSTWFTMYDWRCFSSTDMVNWTHHGAVLSLNDLSWASTDAWAGQCIERNGKFYLYIPAGARVGVAVANNPTGPFTDPLGKPLVTSGNGDIDPTAFIDEDGQAYLYWGNPNLYYVKLNQDMISYSGSIVQVPLTTAGFGVRSDTDRPTQYEEGPWFYKRNSIYYIVFAAGPISEHISYTTSSGPTGPWTFGGIVMPTQGGSFTNHPGVCDYKGNSYLFYHNGALPGGGGFTRSVCVERFQYNSNGSIPTINMTTTGVPQIGNLNPYNTVQAETICWESGVETETCSEGGIDVCNIENGDYIKVKGVDFGTGASSFEARVASATSGGSIEIRLDSESGTLVGTCSVSGTGGWQTWTTRTCTISGTSGVHDLYFRFTGGSGSLFNFNWWKFYGGGGTSPPTPEPTAVSTPGPTGTPNQEPIWSGGPYTLNGTSDYVDLPDGLTNDLYDFSIACWINLNSIDTWSRIFDFGGDTNIFMMLTPASGTTGYPYFCITLTGNDGEQGLNGPGALPTGSDQHFAITKSGSTAILYIDGQEVDRNTNMTLNPADMGNTLNNYIGRSQWEQDPYLSGEVDDFFVYNRAISASEVADLANSSEITPEPTATPTTGTLGDANGDEIVNIVDALLIAQFYVGLDPAGFVPGNADTNCDGNINIVDALLVAQYYVGLLSQFC
jgi:arabinoxylan arabinofuranohydrolase